VKSVRRKFGVTRWTDAIRTTTVAEKNAKGVQPEPLSLMFRIGKKNVENIQNGVRMGV
jgi:hypothetical protein